MIDKPADFTSFDVVAVVRGVFGTKKVGHAGTLDPMATGVLPILLGNATKAQSLMPDTKKEYEADFLLGRSTDTLDITGSVTEERTSRAMRGDVLAVLDDFRGDILQTPPMYSAVSVDGKRLYELARRGIEIEREKRQVSISRLELLDFDEERQCGRLAVACSKGTYIRSLIDDIGRLLGTLAVMTSLRRTSACGYSIEDSVPLERLRSLAENGGPSEALAFVRPTETIFEPYRKIYISPAQARRFCNGGSLDVSRTALAKIEHDDGEIFRIGERELGFIGLGRVNAESGELKFLKLFAEQGDTAER